jgi:hypothetical protein
MGAGVSYGGANNAGYINPQQFAYMKALEEQNQGMALTSLDRSRQKQTQDIQNYFNLAGQAPEALAGMYGMGSGLFTKGMGYEQAGMGSLEAAAGLSGRTTAASGIAGQYLGQGMQNAAGFQAAGSQAYPLAISKAFNTLGTPNSQSGKTPWQDLSSSFGSLFSTPQAPAAGSPWQDLAGSYGTGGSGWEVGNNQQFG